MANFTSYFNALVLMTALCNKLRELNEAYVFKGSVAFANLPSTLTEDMCGYTYNVTDDFTTDNRFVEGAGKSYSAGSNVVVANMTTTTYDEVTPVGTENPSEEGWYEFDGSAYVLTQDTEIQTGKTYYEQVVTPSYKFDVIGNFIDVESIMDSISSVAAMITDATFSPSSAYSIGDIVIYENSLYQFKVAHTADTAWDVTEVDEITVEGQLTTKADVSKVGDNANLTTTEKSTIVGAINELNSTKANTADLGTAAAKGVDATPTASSTNLVESGGVRNVVDVLEGMNGVKNLVPLNSVSASSTGYFGETNVNLPAGEYVMSYRLTTNYNFGVSITVADSNIVKAANHPPYNNTLIVEEIVANGNITKYKFYANQQANVSDFMICTKAAWDAGFTDFQPYALSNTTITPALIELVDSGAKNLLSVDSIVYTGESAGWKVADISPYIASGTYKISCNIERPSGSVASVQVWCKYTDDTTDMVVSNTQTASVVSTITFSKNVKQLSIYCTSTATVKNIMICTTEDWAVSQKYVPYVPSMAEMYEMIKALRT